MLIVLSDYNDLFLQFSILDFSAYTFNLSANTKPLASFNIN